MLSHYLCLIVLEVQIGEDGVRMIKMTDGIM